MAPEMVQRGRAHEIRAARGLALDTAYAADPERLERQRPQPPRLPTAVWINPPKETPSSQ